MSDPSETVGSPAAAALPARLAERALAGLRAASTQHAALLEDGALCARVAQVAVASDFAIDTLRRLATSPARSVMPLASSGL